MQAGEGSWEARLPGPGVTLGGEGQLWESLEAGRLGQSSRGKEEARAGAMETEKVQSQEGGAGE